MREFIDSRNVWKITATCPHGFLEKIMLDTSNGALMIPHQCSHLASAKPLVDTPISKREQRKMLRALKKL